MKLELLILAITLFFIYDTYYDGKYRKLLLSWKKYYQMIFFGLLGLGVYLLLKRNPTQGKNMLLYANNAVKYMPIDKSSLELFSPIIDFTSNLEGGFMEKFNNIDQGSSEKRILSSGKVSL